MISKLRMSIQALAFLILTYGGRFGVNLGYSLPCFSCPFVSGCGGYCFLMLLQRVGVFGVAYISQLFTYGGIQTILYFLLFAILAILLSKIWCGWLCPFGTVQDGLTWLRKKLGIREAEWSWATRDKFKPIKYFFLAIILVQPLLIAYAGLHDDFYLFFCHICPARPLMPLFAGQTRYFSLDFTNNITLVISIISITFAAITVVGCFFKERFFCLVCPMLPLIQIFKKVSIVSFEKNVHTCSGCGNCTRACPMDIRAVSDAKTESKVMDEDCLLCMKCIETCPEDKTLLIKVCGKPIFASSKEYLMKQYRKKG